ncbi:unnamed protein product [Rotaria magnacalcarata]|uniref:Uncharacterized protein n=1 Tax=Rotaria magnacalcarata TaxID=392030 RepID=A0A816WWT2_9BILA|nr:unnamed protein product [Rotaria magnacalcarata]
MPNSTQAVAPYAPRRYQGLDQKTDTVSNQLTVRDVQWNMTDLPSASSSESVPTTSWKPIIIVLTVLVVVVCVAAVGIPFLLLQHQQQVQQLLLQHQRRQPLQLQPQPQQPHQRRQQQPHQRRQQQPQRRRQQQPQRRPLPLRHLRPLPLRVPTTTTTTANLPAACSSYTTISDSTRSVSYTTFVGCDSSSFSSSGMWVRFTGSGGTTIPTYAPGISVCGTSATGWYASALPSSGATVSGTLCYDWGTTCQWSSSIQVANCNTYYVYLLYPSPVCNLRVCTV